MHPAIGAGLFMVGVALFVVGIVDATSGAPSGSLSAKGGDTPWLIFAGVACAILGGVFFSVTVGRGRRSSPAPGGLSSFVPPSASVGISPAQPARSDADPVERLEKLVAVRNAGALTEAEFETQKARILRGS